MSSNITVNDDNGWTPIPIDDYIDIVGRFAVVESTYGKVGIIRKFIVVLKAWFKPLEDGKTYRVNVKVEETVLPNPSYEKIYDAIVEHQRDPRSFALLSFDPLH
ncbi:unnamed protein product [Citrullus colocynthis]|uniref:Uncharacterized protein n=1 Tax=Citrullus colocynthis TaxID=252529 RepID=A0ABP0YL78_9ROSI